MPEIGEPHFKNLDIQNILIKHDEISESKTAIYCWIPSHIGFMIMRKLTKKEMNPKTWRRQILKFLLIILKPIGTSLINRRGYGMKHLITS